MPTSICRALGHPNLLGVSTNVSVNHVEVKNLDKCECFAIILTKKEWLFILQNIRLGMTVMFEKDDGKYWLGKKAGGGVIIFDFTQWCKFVRDVKIGRFN
jgi:hypothetical protein